MTELTMCMAGATLLLVVVCVVTWAQIQRLKTDIKHLGQREHEPEKNIRELVKAAEDVTCHCESIHNEHGGLTYQMNHAAIERLYKAWQPFKGRV